MDFLKWFRPKQKSITLVGGGIPDIFSSNHNEQYKKSLYVFLSVNKIAKKVAAVDLNLYRINNAQGNSTEIFSHPLLDLLHNPNPFQTGRFFITQTIQNRKLAGEAFWLKIRNGKQVVELWNLDPTRITIIKDKTNYIRHYEFLTESGLVRFERDDIVHFKDPNPFDVYRGFSPLIPAKTRVETEYHASRYQAQFFKNNARPDFFLVSDEIIPDEEKQKAREAFNQNHKGAANAGKLGFLEGGMKYQQVSISQREMDYIESMNATRNDIMAAFGVPESMIAGDDVKYANAKEAYRMFLMETIVPEVTLLVDQINTALVPEFDDRLFLDFTDPTPDDRDARLNEFSAGVDKWLTANEVREELNLPSIEGGDELYRPLGVVPIATRPTPTPESDEKVFKGKSRLHQKMQIIDATKKAIKKAQEPKYIGLIPKEIKKDYSDLTNKRIDGRSKRFQDALVEFTQAQQKRFVSSLREDVKQAKEMKEKLSSGDIRRAFKANREKDLLVAFAIPFLREYALQSGQEALGMVGGGDFVLNPSVEKYLRDRADFFASSVNDTTLTHLVDILSDGIQEGEGIRDLTRRVQDVYQEFPDHRAELIARTETTAVNNEATLEGYHQSGVVDAKEWIATKDHRTRDEHFEAPPNGVNGEIVALNANFSNGLPYPSEFNCRCVIAPAVRL